MGLRGFLGTGWPDLDAPDFVIHQSRAGSQRRPGFLHPPLTAFKPVHRLCADRVMPTCPGECGRLAGWRADDVHTFAEQAHRRLPELHSPSRTGDRTAGGEKLN
ncbi:hypothetical protein D9M72_528490 [compost metagenome]